MSSLVLDLSSGGSDFDVPYDLRIMAVKPEVGLHICLVINALRLETEPGNKTYQSNVALIQTHLEAEARKYFKENFSRASPASICLNEHGEARKYVSDMFRGVTNHVETVYKKYSEEHGVNITALVYPVVTELSRGAVRSGIKVTSASPEDVQVRFGPTVPDDWERLKPSIDVEKPFIFWEASLKSWD